MDIGIASIFSGKFKNYTLRHNKRKIPTKHGQNFYLVKIQKEKATCIFKW